MSVMREELSKWKKANLFYFTLRLLSFPISSIGNQNLNWYQLSYTWKNNKHINRS